MEKGELSFGQKPSSIFKKMGRLFGRKTVESSPSTSLSPPTPELKIQKEKPKAIAPQEITPRSFDTSSFIKVRKLGSGIASVVDLYEDPRAGEKVAVKRPVSDAAYDLGLRRETKIMEILHRDPRAKVLIVGFKGVDVGSNVVMEALLREDGWYELGDVVKSLTDSERLTVVKKIIQAMQVLQDNGVTNFDVKTDLGMFWVRQGEKEIDFRMSDFHGAFSKSDVKDGIVQMSSGSYLEVDTLLRREKVQIAGVIARILSNNFAGFYYELRRKDREFYESVSVDQDAENAVSQRAKLFKRYEEETNMRPELRGIAEKALAIDYHDLAKELDRILTKINIMPKMSKTKGMDEVAAKVEAGTVTQRDVEKALEELGLSGSELIVPSYDKKRFTIYVGLILDERYFSQRKLIHQFLVDDISEGSIRILLTPVSILGLESKEWNDAWSEVSLKSHFGFVEPGKLIFVIDNGLYSGDPIPILREIVREGKVTNRDLAMYIRGCPKLKDRFSTVISSADKIAEKILSSSTVDSLLEGLEKY